jgi:hypothetical protein
MRYWKIAFGFLGFFSLYFIINDYGFATLVSDLKKVGWQFVPLSLTFVPTLLCYTMVWYLVTDRPQQVKASLKNRLIFFAGLFRATIIAIAWNNISPFIKVLGEPIRLLELNRFLPDQRLALKSLLIYNLTHTMGTILSFVIAAITIPYLFDVSEQFKLLLLMSVFIFAALLSLFWVLPWLLKRGLRFKLFQKLRRTSLWLRWSVHKISQFYANHYWALLAALGFSVSARFIEGLTFYYAFKILGQPISLLNSAYLDVGRSLADNVFFFVPYQLGSREYAVGFLIKNVIRDGGAFFVAAALFYRLVEIVWMVIGYCLWGFGGKKAKNTLNK